MPPITACQWQNAGARGVRDYFVLLNFVIASSSRCNADP